MYRQTPRVCAGGWLRAAAVQQRLRLPLEQAVATGVIYPTTRSPYFFEETSNDPKSLSYPTPFA